MTGRLISLSAQRSAIDKGDACGVGSQAGPFGGCLSLARLHHLEILAPWTTPPTILAPARTIISPHYPNPEQPGRIPPRCLQIFHHSAERSLEREEIRHPHSSTNKPLFDVVALIERASVIKSPNYIP